MIALAWELVPTLFGIVASPLAIMALIATLLSARARGNGAGFLVGWIIAVAVVVIGVYLLAGEARQADSVEAAPLFGVVRLILGVLLAAGAVWTYRRARASLAAMANAATPEEIADAAPQLPGWLQAVSRFTPGRSLFLGIGIFALNPINVSCAIAAALDIQDATLDESSAAVVLVVFCLLCIIPMAAPVVLLVVKGAGAEAPLQALRGWIVKNNGVVSACFLAIVAFSQIQKAIQTWV
ncbi:GAP family protein [Microbacterium sp. AGC85]